MSILERSFVDAIKGGRIEGVLIEGRSATGTAYSKALGERTLLDGTKKPLTSSDLLALASCTKLLTTVAALQCCERGLLSLDVELSAQFASIVELGVLIDWDDEREEATLEPLRKPITLRQVLTHSAGLAATFADPKLIAWRKANPVPSGTFGVEAQFTIPLQCQPDEGWNYGTGLEWTGLLVERASGMRLDAYFREYIYQPLGLDPSDFSFFPVSEGMGPRMVDMNPRDPKGEGLSSSMGNRVYDGAPGHCYGGGGGFSTASAFIQVLQSLLLNDGKLLQAATAQEMFRPQLNAKTRASLAEKSEGRFGAFYNQSTSGKHPDFGLGGLLVTDNKDESGLNKGTLAWGGGVNSAWFIDPVEKICGFASLQMGIPADIQEGLTLKAVFRKHLKDQLS